MISFKLILGVLFALLVISIAVLGVVSYQNNRVSLENAELVRNTYAVIDQTAIISSLYKDIQLESNAYFIHRDSAIMLPYITARQEINPRIDELQDLTKGNLNQKPRIDSLRYLIGELIKFTNTVIKSDKQFSMGDLDQRVVLNLQFRGRIRKCIDSIKHEEEALLVEREQAYKSSIAAFNKTFSLLIAGIGILLATTFFLIRYNFNKRIKAQEEQRRASELFEKIFYESPMGIVISRLNTGEILDCNNTYTELVRYNKSELIGRTAVQLGIFDSVARRNEIVKDARYNETVRDIEVQLTPRASDPIWVSVSTQQILIDGEECLLSAIVDMTAHKEAEERTKKALASEIELNKLKSNFVTLASHEFRTPLTTISSSAFLIDNYSLGENKEKVTKHIARIKASVNLLISILDEFLSLTKIEEGKVEPRLELINLRETIEKQCHTLKAFAKPGQNIIYHHTGEEQVYSDPVLLGNILNNLVSNAIKYSESDDEILVSTAVNAKVHLSVKDFGIGISKPDQEHLFERFFRAANTGNVQGTGLGLHIMKHYVDVLNGKIAVQSEPGKGSQFDITFEYVQPMKDN
jgi:PAS domain S-box-containing protein